MYRKDWNKRSPLRVFERSTHGGLGKGNLGVIMSRAGVGKTAVMVGIALDDLMREHKVLHVNLHDPVEKVRAFYDEVFQDLAEHANLENRANAHLTAERHRMILSYTGGSFTMEKLRESLDMLKTQMHFEPEAIVIDGYPSFFKATEEQLQELKKLAVDLNAEVWLSTQTHREGDSRDERGVPEKVARFEEYLTVIVDLEPMSDHVKLTLLKDHDNRDIADLHMELDPKTLLLKWR
jgi:replicative DNA helicase